MKIKKLKAERGFIMIVAMALILIFGFLGLIAVYLFNNSALSTNNNLLATQALYVAESGLQYSNYNLNLFNQISCNGINGDANYTNASYSGAAGNFSITAFSTSPWYITLASNINGTDTTIPLSIGIFPFGRIMIDREFIDFSATSGSNLINVTRGADGTTPTAHTSGTPVGQYDCIFFSESGIPNLSSSKGKTTLGSAVQRTIAIAVGTPTTSLPNQLPAFFWNASTNELNWSENLFEFDGSNPTLTGIETISYADIWAVGNTPLTNSIIEHSNDGINWNSVSNSITETLNSISCTASNNCWVVGDNTTFAEWDGSAWNAASVSVANTNYQDVECLNSNNCWAVGGNATIVNWDGTSWSNSTTGSNANTLNSVSCVDSNNCWAVGDSQSFWQWNGSTWSNVNVSTVPAINYNGVFCNAANDCWAAGDASGGSSVLVHWDGTSWTQASSTPTANNLNAVACRVTDDCWAVGTNATTLHWDGSSWTQFSNPGATESLNAVAMIGPHNNPQSGWMEY